MSVPSNVDISKKRILEKNTAANEIKKFPKTSNLETSEITLRKENLEKEENNFCVVPEEKIENGNIFSSTSRNFEIPGNFHNSVYPNIYPNALQYYHPSPHNIQLDYYRYLNSLHPGYSSVQNMNASPLQFREPWQYPQLPQPSNRYHTYIPPQFSVPIHYSSNHISTSHNDYNPTNNYHFHSTQAIAPAPDPVNIVYSQPKATKLPLQKDINESVHTISSIDDGEKSVSNAEESEPKLELKMLKASKKKGRPKLKHGASRKTHKCEFCSYTTTRTTNLENHTRIHTGEKPFQCEFITCTYAASQRCNLEAHKKTHHKS